MAAPNQDAPTQHDPAVTRPERPEASLTVGARLGRYAVLDVLGVGGGGAVYKAFDETLKRNVALKVLHARSGDPTQVVMLREARALAQFSHPNVVAVYDVGEVGDKGFIAMELAEGERLDQWLRQKRPWHQVLKVFLDAARGLAAVHDARLVHRDFKPGNVVVRADGRVQLIDFGIARPDTAADAEPLLMLQISGTPGFMAPEHMRGEQPGTQSDQFSFCCALYEALVGVLPFGESADQAQLTRIEKRQLATAAPAGKVPRRVLELLKRGLSFDPQRRFASMHELVRALARTLPLDRFGWTGVAVLSIAAGAAIGFMWLYSSTRGAGCAADVEAAQRVWNDEARAPLKRKLPPRTLERLDGYAAGLLDASKEVCAASQGPQTSPAAKLEARACLAHARRELASLLQALRTAPVVDPGQVEASVDAMAPARECVGLGPTESDDVAACGQRLFDAVSHWNRGQWTSVLSGATAAQACAQEQHAPDIVSAAHRLRGAVLERIGDARGARAAYQGSVRAALRSRGELLAQAWLSLARLEEPERALELLDWTDGLLESAASAPETRARAALMRLRLSPGASKEEKAALVRATAYSGDDPTQQTVALVARAQVEPAQLGAALSAVSALPSPPVQAVLELAEALALVGPDPLAAQKLLGAGAQALADGDPDTALARSYVAAAVRNVGGLAAAAEAHARILGSLPESAPALVRAVVNYEASRSLRAAGRSGEADEALRRARAVAKTDPALERWLGPKLEASAHPTP